MQISVKIVVLISIGRAGCLKHNPGFLKAFAVHIDSLTIWTNKNKRESSKVR